MPPMLDPEVKRELDKRFSLLAVICGSMAANVAVLWAASAVLAGRSAPVPAAGAVKTLLLLLAALEIGLVLRLRRRLLSDEGLGAAAGRGPRDLLAAIQTRHIVLFAVWESFPVYGLVLALLAARPAEFWPFGAASIVGMALCWPRLGDWEGRIAALLRK